VKQAKKAQSTTAEAASNQGRQVLIVFAVICVFTVVISVVSIYILSRRLFSAPQAITPATQKSVFDTTNVENIDLIVNKLGVAPSTIRLKTGKDYNFRIIKNSGVTCEALRNEDTNITIVLGKTATEFPVSIRSKGEFVFECVNQDATLKVIVE
jgi:hypothetical protein